MLVCYRDDSGKEPKFGSVSRSFFLAACARRRSAHITSMAERRRQRWWQYVFAVLGAFGWFGFAIAAVGTFVAGLGIALYRLARGGLRHA